jgi:PIN domain nuclease of toxin-antitoxin system
MKAVLDTHAALFSVLGLRALGQASQKLLADAGPADLAISDVTLTETARLLQTGRLAAARPGLEWLEDLAIRFTVQLVTPVIAWRAAAHAFAHRDPCDRHILATADVLGLPLVTADRVLTHEAALLGVKAVW